MAGEKEFLPLARFLRHPSQEQESPTCPPDRSSKILLVQVGTLSSSHPSFGVSVFFLSVLAHRLDTGANWRVLVLSPAHHRSRLSDSVKNGNALSSVHNAAVPAR